MNVKETIKRIHVVAGIIWNSSNDCLLISRRPIELHKGGYWEFPGGKVENGESEEEALVRELREELDIGFSGSEKFCVIEHDYPEKQVKLAFYHVREVSGEPVGMQGQEWRWIPVAELSHYQFPEANQPVVEALIKTV